MVDKPTTRPKIKLIGMNGNAYNILGIARKAAREAGWTAIEMKAYMDEATKGDYYHLLSTTMDWFDVDSGAEESEDTSSDYCEECGNPSEDCECDNDG